MTTRKRRCPAEFLLRVALALLASMPLAQAEVRLPAGEYTETVEDLKVKVLGGYVTVSRSWTDGRWYVNPAWTDLILTYDSLDGSVKGIERAGTIYVQVSFQLDGSGKRTQALDHLGQLVLSFQYTGGQLTGVTDRVGRQVQYHYT